MNRVKDASTETDCVDFEKELKSQQRKHDLIREYEKIVVNKRRLVTASILTLFGVMGTFAAHMVPAEATKAMVSEQQKETRHIKKETLYTLSTLAYVGSLPFWVIAACANRRSIKNIKGHERDS